MCGIFGILSPGPVSLSDDHLARLRDTLSHRGPDAAHLYRNSGCILAHRRLIVIDPTDAAAQPMVSSGGGKHGGGGGRFALVYNGELYNDADLRRELAAEGLRFSTASDTETVLAALSRWGADALPRFRGMYALAFYDSVTHRLLLARDPLGIKPLYYRLGPTADGPSLIFASEPRAILEHPDVPARPDLLTISSYLSTIRTVMGDRTLFEGVRILRPGESLEFYADGGEVGLARRIPPPTTLSFARPALARDVLSTITESIHLHLRADVPLCCMLSGGLDSSIIASTIKPHVESLHTYCSGAEGADDFPHARLMAQRLNASHTEAPISRELFAQRWPELIARQGLPLSTPNEVAINEIARRMRAAGHVVTLSGEGADELFGGYDIPMLDAAQFEGLLPRNPEARWFRPGVLTGGDFQLASTAWIHPDDKPALLSPDVWRIAEHDDHLRQFYREEFERSAAGAPDDSPLQAHLRFQRRINLTGLLARLDSATMLEGIESRTPFADVAVAALAENLPMTDKFHWSRNTSSHLHPSASSAATSLSSSACSTPLRETSSLHIETKRVLRSAFSGLPAEVLTRKKSSFPLPMQTWVADQVPAFRRSRFARELFTIAAIETIAAQPERCWPLAWPMMNIALWGQEWWGS